MSAPRREHFVVYHSISRLQNHMASPLFNPKIRSPSSASVAQGSSPLSPDIISASPSISWRTLYSVCFILATQVPHFHASRIQVFSHKTRRSNFGTTGCGACHEVVPGVGARGRRSLTIPTPGSKDTLYWPMNSELFRVQANHQRMLAQPSCVSSFIIFSRTGSSQLWDLQRTVTAF
jgi:hypothetical protein